MKKFGLFFIGAALSVMAAFGAGALSHTDRVEKVSADDAGWGTAFVHGNWNGTDWTDKSLEFNAYENRYQVTVTVEAGVQFLFSGGTNVWVKRNWAGVNGNDTWNRFTNNVSDNFSFKYAGTYTLYVDRWVVEGSHTNPGYGCHIEDGYVFFFSEGNVDTNRYIYTYGTGNFYGNFRTTFVKDVSAEVAGVINYRGTYQKIYKLPICRGLTTHLIFADGSSQSGDLLFTNKYGYFWTDGDGASYADDGAAIDWMIHCEAIRNASSYKGKANSLCGVSDDARSALISAYNSLSAGAKTKVNASFTNTWSSAEGDAKKNWYFSDIIRELNDLEEAANSSVISKFAVNDNNSGAITAIAVSFVATMAAAGFVFIRKKKVI